MMIGKHTVMSSIAGIIFRLLVLVLLPLPGAWWVLILGLIPFAGNSKGRWATGNGGFAFDVRPQLRCFPILEICLRIYETEMRAMRAEFWGLGSGARGVAMCW